jgi:hypothetical protein
MAAYLRVREQDRDDELGIMRKDIKLPGGFSFESPSRAVARASDETLTRVMVNEVPKKITDGTVVSLETGTSTLRRDIESQFIDNALNLVIFDLKFDDVPPSTSLRTIAEYLYAASDKVVMLPTVKPGLLKEKSERPRFSDTRIQNYLRMMSEIIEQIGMRNSKAIMGTVPLVPAKFSREILQLYFSKGIESFAIDAGTKDILNNEPDFRLILEAINRHKPLSEVFVYACNLGYPQFETQYARADDFLSIFAYVDVLGGTFKTRGGPMAVGQLKRPEPRAKIFLRERYAYEMSTFEKIGQKLGRLLSRSELQNYNQMVQLQEANNVRSLVGQESMRQYISSKPQVDHRSLNDLMSIAKGVARC